MEPLHMADMSTILCPVFNLGHLFKAQNSILESQRRGSLESLLWDQSEVPALLTTDLNKP